MFAPNDGFKEGLVRTEAPPHWSGVSTCGPPGASSALEPALGSAGEIRLQVISRRPTGPSVQSKLGTSGPLTDGASKSVEREVLQLLHFLSSLLWDVHSAVTHIAAHLAPDPEQQVFSWTCGGGGGGVQLYKHRQPDIVVVPTVFAQTC